MKRLKQHAVTVVIASLAMVASACIVRTAPRQHHRAHATGSIYVGSSAPDYYVTSDYPPEPLYEAMTSSPGSSYVWIDGYWSWNGYDWEWVSGSWVQGYANHVYIQPTYGYTDRGYVYQPGYWCPRNRVPSGVVVRDHRDGRPSVGRYNERVPSSWGTRSPRKPPRTSRPPRTTVRDHRDRDTRTRRPPRKGTTRPPRDHRDDTDTRRPPRTTGGTTTRPPRDTDTRRPPRTTGGTTTRPPRDTDTRRPPRTGGGATTRPPRDTTTRKPTRVGTPRGGFTDPGRKGPRTSDPAKRRPKRGGTTTRPRPPRGGDSGRIPGASRDRLDGGGGIGGGKTFRKTGTPRTRGKARTRTVKQKQPPKKSAPKKAPAKKKSKK